jgi:hypothetical protein
LYKGNLTETVLPPDWKLNALAFSMLYIVKPPLLLPLLSPLNTYLISRISPPTPANPVAIPLTKSESGLDKNDFEPSALKSF